MTLRVIVESSLLTVLKATRHLFRVLHQNCWNLFLTLQTIIFKCVSYPFRLNWQDPLNRKFLHKCRAWQEPRQPVVRHSLTLVLATIFGFLKGKQGRHLSELDKISNTLPPRLHSKKSVSTAPWLVRMNFKISDSITSELSGVFDGMSRCCAGKYCYWRKETET